MNEFPTIWYDELDPSNKVLNDDYDFDGEVMRTSTRQQRSMKTEVKSTAKKSYVGGFQRFFAHGQNSRSFLVYLH